MITAAILLFLIAGLCVALYPRPNMSPVILVLLGIAFLAARFLP